VITSSPMKISSVAHATLGSTMSGNQFEKSVTEVFRFYDSDHDGILSAEECVFALRSLGVVIEDSDTFTKPVNFSDFTLLVESFKKSNRILSPHNQFLKSLRGAFDAVDAAKKGHVTVDKLKHVLCTMGTPLTDSEFKSLFPSALGTVTFDQLFAVIAKSA
jgi:Ca2+-binding EF-hand superfamily protein